MRGSATLSITSTTPDATELGFLLHKHPDRVRSADVGFGRAHVFYPEASPERCTATLFGRGRPNRPQISQSSYRSPQFGAGLLPVLDDRKHYWIGDDEVDKLLRRGGDWLSSHPDVEFITRRYLRFGGLAKAALAQLAEDAIDTDALDQRHDDAEAEVERPLSLNQQRLQTVTAAVVAAGGGRVVDLGCGEGRLVQRLAPRRAHLQRRSNRWFRRCHSG